MIHISPHHRLDYIAMFLVVGQPQGKPRSHQGISHSTLHGGVMKDILLHQFKHIGFLKLPPYLYLEKMFWVVSLSSY